MPFELTGQVFLNRATGLLRRAPGRLKTGTEKGLRTYVQGYVARFKAARLSGRNRGRGLEERSGALRRRLTWDLRGSSLASLALRIGWRNRRDSMVARVQEFGATINAGSKLLTVPLRDALTSAGVKKKARATDWTNTFVFKTRRGELIIAQRRGKSKLVYLYVLKKSVRIPARLGFRAFYSLSRERAIRLRDIGRALNLELRHA